jgi:two-component system sensor histidine kinase RegB
MDRPLLALTRRQVPSRAVPSPEVVATENMRQLVQLRWIAVIGQLVTILAVDRGLGMSLPLGLMFGLVAVLALANVMATLLLSRRRVTNAEMMLALLLDMGVLTAQLYLSGGATNPFVSLFLLQVVLGAILLEAWSVWVLVAAASLCYAGLTLNNRPLVYPSGLALDIADLYTLGAWISFALIGMLLGLFTTRITRNLRAREHYLADLRQHAAEEDAIVRMGLFASGAAHELGTPLASLSVILNDWRRMPKLAQDPELIGELEEMQAEVQRCKAIVTDILASAGKPRSEAIDSTGAGAFLDDVVAAWRPTHAATRLDYARENLEGAALVAGASLRQALWSLLDNAAEASPDGIGLVATREVDELRVEVTDKGSGFSEAQLAMVGKAHYSSKGAGHGLGLFLASNVARRLGGRLEVANRTGGGAEVRLILPLADDQPQEI